MRTVCCSKLGGMEGKCRFYGSATCTGCHTSIYISGALICTAKGVCEAIIWPYVRAAPLRRSLLAISLLIHLTIPHLTYQFTPSTYDRTSPWWSVLYFYSPPEARRTKEPLTLLTSSKTSHLSSVSMSFSSPSTW